MYDLRLIETLSLVMIITSVAAVESQNLKRATTAYCIQALLICGLILAFAVGNPALYVWAAVALITKAIITPWLLLHYIGKTGENEVRDHRVRTVRAARVGSADRLVRPHAPIRALPGTHARGRRRSVPHQLGGEHDGLRARSLRHSHGGMRSRPSSVCACSRMPFTSVWSAWRRACERRPSSALPPRS